MAGNKKEQDFANKIIHAYLNHPKIQKIMSDNLFEYIFYGVSVIDMQEIEKVVQEISEE